MTQYSKKLNQTILNTITDKGRVQINAKFESSHFWCPRKSQHTNPQLASQPETDITYIFAARSSRSFPSCVSLQPLLLPTIPLCRKLDHYFISPSIPPSVAPDAQAFLQMAPGTSQGMGTGTCHISDHVSHTSLITRGKALINNSISEVNIWSANNR